MILVRLINFPVLDGYHFLYHTHYQFDVFMCEKRGFWVGMKSPLREKKFDNQFCFIYLN